MSNLDFTVHSYCKTAFARNADELIHNAEMQLTGQNIDFDSMVGIGNSGLLVLPILARHFDVPFFAMRKPGTSHHNSRQPHGDGIIGRRWILVDDVSVTGNTMTYVCKTIRQLAESKEFSTEYVGTYLYEPMSMSPGEFIYPDDARRSVQRITIDGYSYHVSFGEYNTVRDTWRQLYSPDVDMVELVTGRVNMRFPSWNRVTTKQIAKSLLKDHNVS